MMASKRQQKFLKYLNQRKEQDLDQALGAYLNEIRTSFGKGLASEDLVSIIVELMVVLPMHLSRKHIDLIRQGGAPAVIHGFEGVPLGHDVDVKESLDSILKPASVKRPLIWTLPDPTSIAGYDPRFVQKRRRDNPDSDEQEDDPNPDEEETISQVTRTIYEELLSHAPSITKDSFDRLDFFCSYAKAKSCMYRDFHDSARRYDLLLIDLSWLPELAYSGSILPLERFDPNVEESLKSELSGYFNPEETAKLDFWTGVASELARGGNDNHYGLPLFLNTHCRLVPQGCELGSLDARYESTKRDRLMRGSIQAKHSASCVYQLFAHFAYTGAEPIKVRWGAAHHPEAEVNFLTDSCLQAFALLLARLYMLDYDVEGYFRIGHEEEVARLENGDWLWSPAFNSELARRKPPRLTVTAPFKAERHSRWLASVGGYALAISSKSVDPMTTYRFALELHKCALNKGVNDDRWAAIPPTAKNAFASVGSIRDFIRLHCRPRTPFWTHIEELISFAVQEVATQMRSEVDAETLKRCGDSDTLGEWAESIRKWLKETPESSSPNTLSVLNERVKHCFTNNGWSVG